MSYQIHVVEGNLGRDPELQYTSEGIAFCNFSIAVNSYRGKTQWFRITTRAKLAESCHQYLRRGSRVLVQGTDLSVYPYLDKKENLPAATLELYATDVQFLGKTRQQEESGDDTPSESEEEVLF